MMKRTCLHHLKLKDLYDEVPREIAKYDRDHEKQTSAAMTEKIENHPV